MRRILWFRRDLRVEDNPLLSFGGEVFPIFIFDINILDMLVKEDRRVGMIFNFVLGLKSELQALGLDLKIFYGSPVEIFDSFNVSEFDEVVASGDYDSYAKERDRAISELIHFRYVNDTYLFHPKEVLKKDGSPYLVFTPFYKAGLKVLETKEIKTYKKASQKLYNYEYSHSLTPESMGFSSQGCSYRYDTSDLDKFLTKLHLYKEQRDYLEKGITSNISIALRFGLVSIREVYTKVKQLVGSEAFIRQLIFRDFYAYLLFHFPYLEKRNYKGALHGVEDKKKLEQFCSAQTGVPIVDAGVKELLETGRMHNRVRMVTASFFTKDLLLPWQWGEQFFASHLLDYDKASNVLSWQWSAGTGIDPQPYFRVFNPYLQSKKFDNGAHYIKKHLLELEKTPAKYLHNEDYLIDTDIENYPQPILKHKQATQLAIEKFKNGV